MSLSAIVPYNDSAHRKEVILLWQAVFGYQAAHNEPGLVIGQKVTADDGLFWVAVQDDHVVGSIMAGYDGHRGWLYSLAVLPEYRHRNLGSALVRHAEEALTDKGCLKVNLQIVEGNEGVQAFYASLGYAVEVRISMGKRLPISDMKPSSP